MPSENRFSENCLRNRDSTESTHFIETLSEPTVVVVDFDETLFLRNSTEEYLDSLRPQFLGNLLLIAIEKLSLWRWLPQSLKSRESADWLRVLIGTLLFPWTVLIWRRKAPSLARNYVNSELLQSLSRNPYARVIIATRGFEFIVQPLLAYMPLNVEALQGCRFWRGGLDRQKGKEEMLSRLLSEQEIKDSALITDSLDDASLLAIAKYPFLVQWPQAKYVRAMSGAYLPLFYIEKVKKPGQKFLKRIILKDHIVALLLTYTWSTPMPVLHGLGMALLALSFWCVYEIGYFENDLIAERYEEKPVLSETYQQYKDRMNIWLPWIVSLVLGVAGIALVMLGNELSWATASDWSLYANALSWKPFLINLGIWTAALGLSRLMFLAYNYIDESTRIWLYPILQLSKYASFLLITRISTVGIALLIAQVFVEWVPYIIYRCGGDRGLLKEQIFRLFIFVSLVAAIAIAQREIAIFLTAQFVVILLWSLSRSVTQAKEIVKDAHFIWN